MSTIHAIYEDGVFRPMQPIQLPDRCEVEFEPRIIQDAKGSPRDEIYNILDKRFDSGSQDVAERHNEHQP